jgi:hypothetical protein
MRSVIAEGANPFSALHSCGFKVDGRLSAARSIYTSRFRTLVCNSGIRWTVSSCSDDRCHNMTGWRLPPQPPPQCQSCWQLQLGRRRCALLRRVHCWL